MRGYLKLAFLLLLTAGSLRAETGTVGRVYIVNRASPAANDRNPGTAAEPLRTINAAAQLAGPGDTVRVQAGIYRERVTPARGGRETQPIIYQAASGERVVVKGSDVWTDWHPYGDSPDVSVTSVGDVAAYRTGISIAPKDQDIVARPSAKTTNLPKTLGQLFCDGQPMIQADSVATVIGQPNTWVVLPEGRQLIAHFTGLPAEHLIELTVRDRIFCPAHRGLGYLQVKGFTFEHCANQGPFPQGGAVSPRSGHHWLIEGDTIRFAKTVGLDVGSETWSVNELKDTPADEKVKMEGGHHVVQGNTITDNGLCGIEGWKHNGVVIRNNIIERNNRLDFSFLDAQWEEWAGIKLHGGAALIEGNLIRNNEGYGIWLDNGYQGSRITRNIVLNNRMAGIFLELGAGEALIDNNIVAFTRPRGIYYPGTGIYAHDASDLTVAHNLILENAGGGVVMRTTSDRKFAGKLVATSNERILNNIIWNNSQAAISLPFPNPRGEHNRSDYNLLSGAHEYWQGMKEPWRELFAVNKFKGEIPMEEIVAKLKATLEATKTPVDEWPNLKYWAQNPVLPMSQWRQLMELDLHSVEAPGALKILVRPQALTATIQAQPIAGTLAAKKITGIDRDFFGVTINPDHVLPGPFQKLEETETEYVLFPVVK